MPMAKHPHVDADLAADPILMPHQGRLVYLFPSGRMVPDIRGGEGPDDDKKFTQADMDRVVEDRLRREREKPPAPPADYAALQAAATELAALKAKDNTELDNAKTEIARLQGENTKLTGERDGALDTVTALRIDGELLDLAVKAGAKNPKQAVALIKNEHKDAVTVGDDDKVTGAAEAAKAFFEDAGNAHHVGTTTATRRTDPAQSADRTDTTTPGAAGAAEALKRFGPPAGATTATQR